VKVCEYCGPQERYFLEAREQQGAGAAGEPGEPEVAAPQGPRQKALKMAEEAAHGEAASARGWLLPMASLRGGDGRRAKPSPPQEQRAEWLRMRTSRSRNRLLSNPILIVVPTVLAVTVPNK
jgi:hypothetical protein